MPFLLPPGNCINASAAIVAMESRLALNYTATPESRPMLLALPIQTLLTISYEEIRTSLTISASD